MILLLFLFAAAVQGAITDAQKHPVPAATVTLQQNNSGFVLQTQTNPQGEFRFPSVPPGAYTLRAEKKPFSPATSAPFNLSANESKQIGLTLPPALPDFDGEPNFVVAGVTDATAHGGHGSDTVLRSADSLAQATASLGQPPAKDPLAAVRQYQTAAGHDPSESNLFNWGSELLLHRATEPAIEVFNKGVRLHANSVRMRLGLATALYANGVYPQAAQRFFEACDQNPSDPNPYLFLAKVQTVAITDLPGYTARMARFAELNPANAEAQYYYAVCLWKHHENPERVEALLKKALELNPKLGEAYLEQGILQFDQNNLTQARAAFEQAIQINPRLEEAHYRLSQTYRRLGDPTNASKELAIYNQLSKATPQQPPLQQFIYELRR